MSLVNYGASDESDASDAEDEPTVVNTQSNRKDTDSTDTVHTENLAVSGHISDEDEFETVSSTSVTSSSATGHPSSQHIAFRSHADSAVNSTSVTSLEDLPAPHSKSKSDTTEVEEKDLEEEVKPKASEIANAPKPPPKKTKQPVKITIPSLDETPEEEVEVKKKAAPSTVKSGLFSLLPAPMHSAKKEINRPLIPHSLTKKPASAKPAASSSSNRSSPAASTKSSSDSASTSDISSKRMTPFNALTGYDSDSDDENENTGSSANFFSLNSSSEVKAVNSTPTANSERLQSEEVSSSGSDVNVSKQTVTDASSTDAPDVSANLGSEEEEEEEEDKGPEPGAINDAPLDFRSVNRLSAWSGSSYGFLGPVGPAGPIPQTSYTSYPSSYSVPSSAQYNLANADVGLPGGSGDAEFAAVGDDDLKQFMSDKEFQKLQGKRKRGLEEAISFVDANVDDYVDPSEVSKHLTEETEYVSHKNKDNLPTAQQRRKKQITYLAYQAKERELELKNNWAQNRMTKKQTQSKYGF